MTRSEKIEAAAREVLALADDGDIHPPTLEALRAALAEPWDRREWEREAWEFAAGGYQRGWHAAIEAAAGEADKHTKTFDTYDYDRGWARAAEIIASRIRALKPGGKP